MPKISVGGNPLLLRKIPVAKKFMDKRGERSIKIFRRKLFVSQCRKSPQGILYCCINFLISGSEKVWIGGWGGVSRFSVENFFPHGAENFRRRIFYCCSNFGYRKRLDEKGGVSRLSVENFFTHSTENFRRVILYSCINFRLRKSLDKQGGGEYQDFLSKFFCLTMPKISVVGNRLLLH